MRSASTTVASFCIRDVVTVTRETPVLRCAQLMHDEHVGAVVIIDDIDGKLVSVGLLIDRDIAIEVVAFGLDPATLTAADVMSTPAATVKLDADLMEALSIMREQGIRRLIVVKRDGELAGVLAVDDLQQAFAEELDGLSSVMRAELQRERSTRGGSV